MIKRQKSAQAGFTLVELAIVMIIIGLLIAGVLKGQALIANAQVTATVAQLKSVEAAINTFKDTYGNNIPGDVLNANVKLPNCAGPCVVGASAVNNGNGRLENTPAITPIGAEGEAFFPQLSAAGLVTGLAGAAAGSTAAGGNFPSTKISNNVLQAGSAYNNVAGDFTNMTGTPGIPHQGLYLTISKAVGIPSTGLTPDQASRIDLKVDDGVPDQGLVLAFGTTGNTNGANNCGTATNAGVGGVYATDTNVAACGLYVHMNN